MGYWIHVDELPTGGGGGGGDNGGGSGCGCLMFLITAGLLIANGSGFRTALVGGLLVGGVAAVLFSISGFSWGDFTGALGCLGFLAVVLVLWYLHTEYGLENLLVSGLVWGLLGGSVLSVIGIIYILREVEFERAVIIAGAAGFAAGAVLLFIAGFGFPGCLILAPIAAVAVMHVYCRFF